MASKDEWSLKEVRMKDSPVVSFFRKNLMPSVVPGNDDYSYLVYLTFHYTPKDASGLPTKEIEEILFNIEDSVILMLENEGLSIHIAAVLQNGIKDLLFHTNDPDKFLERATYFRDKYPELNVECEITSDPKWEQYHDFP